MLCAPTLWNFFYCHERKNVYDTYRRTLSHTQTRHIELHNVFILDGKCYKNLPSDDVGKNSNKR